MPEVADGLKQAKAVFVGEVEKVIPPRTTNKNADFFDRAYTIRFKIERSWKGMPFGYVNVRALQGDEVFALPRISEGERYLVYADPVFSGDTPTNELMVGACNRTALLTEPQKQRGGYAVLGIGREDPGNDIRALDGLILLPERSRR